MPIRPIALVSLLLLGAGCAERTRLPVPVPPSDAGVSFGAGSIAEFAGRFSQALCALQVRCGLDGSVVACQRDLTAYWKNAIDLVQVDVDAGKVVVDPARADACIASIGDAGCPTRSAGPEPWSLGCPDLFMGTLSDGEPCVRDIECGSGFCRRFLCTDVCCLGTCAGRIPEGEKCREEISSGCAPGTACVFHADTRTRTCVARMDQGQPCAPAADNPCLPGLECDTLLQQCLPPPKDGEPCDRGAWCDGYTSYCEPSRRRCQARKPVGAVCQGFDCVPYASCAGGVCVALPGVGDPCAPSNDEVKGAWCRPAAGRCMEGHCQWPWAVSDPPCTVESASVPDGGAAVSQ